jgi:peptidoglycan hydrolase-like protein with peptidoglycan-binding domain
MESQMNIREIQVHLTDAGFSPGAPDGELGPMTKAAIAAALERTVPGEWSGWSEARRLVAVEQVILRDVGRLEVGKIDGRVGPQTSYARLQWQAGPWRDRLLEPTLAPAAPTPSSSPLQTDVERFYGARGTRQVQLTLPYPMRIAWDPDEVVRRFSIHELVAPSAERALTRIRDHYGLDGVRLYGLDLWGGCLNVRKMRGGSA